LAKVKSNKVLSSIENLQVNISNFLFSPWWGSSTHRPLAIGLAQDKLAQGD
jgi:hypothetical protein